MLNTSACSAQADRQVFCDIPLWPSVAGPVCPWVSLDTEPYRARTGREYGLRVAGFCPSVVLRWVIVDTVPPSPLGKIILLRF